MAVSSQAIQAATHPVAAAALALHLVGTASALPASQSTRIAVSEVEGRLVARCDISTRSRRLPVNLFIDFEETCGLQLHNQAAAGLKAERCDGTASPITVHFPNLNMTVERREIGDDEALDHRAGNLSVDALSVVILVASLLGRLDTLVIRVNFPRPRGAGRRR